MTDFEQYIIDKIDTINCKVHSIDKKLARFAGGVTVAAAIISIIVTKML